MCEDRRNLTKLTLPCHLTLSTYTASINVVNSNSMTVNVGEPN